MTRAARRTRRRQPTNPSDPWRVQADRLRELATWLDRTRWLRSPELAGPEADVVVAAAESVADSIALLLTSGDVLVDVASAAGVDTSGAPEPPSSPVVALDADSGKLTADGSWVAEPQPSGPDLGRLEALQLLRFGLRGDWDAVQRLLLSDPHMATAIVHLVAIAADALRAEPVEDPASMVEDLLLTEASGYTPESGLPR